MGLMSYTARERLPQSTQITKRGIDMTNLERYNKIFMDVFNVNASQLNESFTFKTVPQWDSVAHLSLISELEDAFDILFDSEDILHYGSYENGKKILKKYSVDI